ncbi:MAG: amidohydrolase family protein [Treponema sp.]|jgi:dihydroorotase|nr:amidohydrolase family protein [Treponema sp.]
MGQKILIKNGRIIDPARGIDQTGSVLTDGSRIAEYSEAAAMDAEQVFDATGCIVTPGLIDFHIHLARHITDAGVLPDVMGLPNGITAAVDQGSCGTANIEGFIRHTVASSEMTLRAFLNVSAIGVTTERHPENPDPATWDTDRIAYLFDQYPGFLLGLKLRMGKGFSTGWGIKTLEAALKISGQIQKPLCVHLTNSELPYEDIVSLLRPGDILCHCYQGIGDYTILGKGTSGSVIDAVREARKRGVLFDVASGRINYNIKVMQAAFADGFLPDIISTDAVSTSVYNHKLFHLLFVLSRHFAMGTALIDALRCCTAAPARLMGLEGKIGTLAPGSQADIAVFRLRDKPVLFKDREGNELEGKLLLIPQLTVHKGRVAYAQMDFVF